MDKLINLGIDPWRILFYLLNTGILLAVLTYLLYKPIFKFIDQRRAQIIESIEESKRLQASFEEKLAQSEKKRHAVEAELKKELDKLNKYIEEKRAELVSEMEQARTGMMQKAQEEIDRRKAALLQEAEQEVRTLMTRIILEVVEHKVPEGVVKESITSAWEKYTT